MTGGPNWEIKAKAPGKVIFFGEYLVLYGNVTHWAILFTLF